MKDTLLGMLALVCTTLLLTSGCGGALDSGPPDGSPNASKRDNGFNLSADCTSDADCSSDAYCKKQACGAKTGSCETKPQACTEQYSPVCGCDGQTYSNACKAASHGVSVASQGECSAKKPPRRKPTPKGCQSDADCSSGQYCKKQACGASIGSCETKPQACTEQYSPVCGCDGQTYGNACKAAGHGVSVAHSGECKSR